ncbi:MAG: carboxypeptidase-like regulatory domain-containing protein [Planctomycetaceae bacterium]|nr:carboxypeptidase-like regulatory domain-containing protein [Planctomycetaceae bacterium]
MKNLIYTQIFGLFLITTFLSFGCAKNDPLKEGLVPASGTITYNGLPLSEATIVFVSRNDNPGAGALSDANGKFTLGTVGSKDGAFAGEYAVFVKKEFLDKQLTDEEYLEYSRQGKTPPAPKSLIPEKYTNPDATIITITIPEIGDKNILIELKD